MFWFILVAILIVVIIAAASTSSNHSSKPHAFVAAGKRYVLRNGKAKEADDVFEAWTSGDLNAMLAQFDQKTTLVDRHFLLMNIVGQTYKHRDDPAMRQTCHKVAQMHIAKCPRLKPALKRSLGVLPRVPTFQQYPTLLTEEGAF